MFIVVYTSFLNGWMSKAPWFFDTLLAAYFPSFALPSLFFFPRLEFTMKILWLIIWNLFQPGLHTCFVLVKFQSVLILLCIKYMIYFVAELSNVSLWPRGWNWLKILGICYRWDVMAVGLSTFVWNQSHRSACPWVKGQPHPPWVVAQHINFVRSWIFSFYMKHIT